MTTIVEKPGFNLLTKIGTDSKEVLKWLLITIVATGLALLAVDVFDLGWSWVEVLGTTTGAVTVWLLAKNRPLGWWWSIVSVICFVYVFYNVELYGEVAIQIFYLITGFQAIWLWVRGGAKKEGRPITNVTWQVVAITIPLFLLSWVGVYFALEALNGAVPLVDAFTTVMSITAHLWLVFRFVQSWWLWIAVDLVYIPLYLTRDLQLTSALYVLFLMMSIMGAIGFYKDVQSRKALEAADA